MKKNLNSIFDIALQLYIPVRPAIQHHRCSHGKKLKEPIIGASVIVKGTTNGTVTDLDGKFTIQASKSSVLIVSFIGYTPQEFTINGNQTFLSNLFSGRYANAGRSCGSRLWYAKESELNRSSCYRG